MSLTMEEFRKKAQEGRKRKITREQLQEWGRKSVQVRVGNMSPEERSQYFKRVRKGVKVT